MLPHAPLLAIAVPFIFAALSPLLVKPLKARGWFATLGAIISFVFVVSMLPDVLAGKTIIYEAAWIPSLDVHLALYVDALSLLFALIATGFGIFAMLYSVDDMAHEGEGLARFYVWMILFLGSMVGLVLAGDLLLMFVFWEMTSLTSYGLISFYKGVEDVRGGTKAFVITHVGGIFLLLGIFVVYLKTGSFLFTDVAAAGLPAKDFWLSVAIASFIIGAMAKSVQFPMHNWLPDATVAPSPVTAYLHAAAMVKAGVYLIARMYTLFPESFGALASWHAVVVLIGVATMLVASFNMIVQRNFKRLIAYCTITQIGYMVMALGLGTTLGVAAGLFHCLNHAVFKGCLFLCAGALIYATGSKYLDDYGGLARNMPITAAATIISAMAVAGVPPLSGFASKWLIFNACLEAGYAWAAVIAMFVSALTLAAFVMAIHSAFFGRRPERLKDVKEVPATMSVTLLILSAITVLFGVAPQLPMKYLILPAATTLTTAAAPVEYYGLITDIGVWGASAATALILVGLVIGALIYLWGIRTSPKAPTPQKLKVFIGGEEFGVEETQFSALNFYSGIKTHLKGFYDFAFRGGVDIINFGAARVVQRACNGFRRTHTGSVHMYLLWFVAFAIILFTTAFIMG